MHIVFLTNEYPVKNESYGGIGTFVKYLANQLVLHSIKVSVIGINHTNEEVFFLDNQIEIYKLKKSNWKFAKFKDHCNRILKKITILNKKEKIDIVEGSELNFAFFPKKTHYKKVIRLHGGHHFFASELNRKPALWRGFQEKKSFKNADAYVAVSNYVGNKTKELLNYNFNFTVIYNSIDLSKFYKSDLSKEKKGKLVFIGTVCYKKGIDNLLASYSVLKKKFPYLSLEIIGRDWQSKEIPSYIQHLKKKFKNSIDKDVVFRGRIPNNEIQKNIEKAAICIYPSLSESFGITVIEAMAMGKAIVISDIEPFKEIIGNSNSALLFEKEEVNSLVENIIQIIENKSLKQQLKEKSRTHIFDKFESEKIVNKNLKFYKSIIL